MIAGCERVAILPVKYSGGRRGDRVAAPVMILGHVINLQSGWIARPGDGAVWTRRFGRPAEMPAGERLVLVVETVPNADLDGVAGAAIVVLNGRPATDLPPAESRRGGAGVGRLARDVTDTLEPRNVLEILVAAQGGAPDTSRGTTHLPMPEEIARVWLEIQRPRAGDDHP